MTDNYEWDLFISYRHLPLMRPWVSRVIEIFRFWLGEEEGQARTIFFDTECIETGDRWPDALRRGLAHSRCMVAIWSPSYFQSSWCVSEWQTFLVRERSLGLAEHHLIMPINFHDGEKFPDSAKETQWEDFTDYAVTLGAFWETVKATELEEKIKAFAKKVSRRIAEAPPFDSNWPLIEGMPLDQPHVELQRIAA